jgi:hypothetical protein
VPLVGAELEDEAEAVDEAHFPPRPVPKPHELEEEDEDEAYVEVDLLLVVLLALLVCADVEEVHGLVGTAMVTT